MLILNNEFVNTADTLGFIGDGVLVGYQKYSGSFLMLKNYIKSFEENCSREQACVPIKFYSLSDEDPLLMSFVNTYQVQDLPALFIVRNKKVSHVINGPIRKSEILNQLKLLSYINKETPNNDCDLFRKTSPFRQLKSNEYVRQIQ